MIGLITSNDKEHKSVVSSIESFFMIGIGTGGKKKGDHGSHHKKVTIYHEEMCSVFKRRKIKKYYSFKRKRVLNIMIKNSFFYEDYNLNLLQTYKNYEL